MAEPIEPENEPETEPTDQDEDAEGAPVDPDVLTGFSAEQRRFLWTLAGLNVVGVLLGAAIVVVYLASARSQDTAIVKLSDEYQTRNEEFERARQIDLSRIVSAELTGNDDASKEARQELLEAYSNRETARANLRRAQGLSWSDVTDEKIEQFSTNLESLVSRNVAAARASTQPASRPATKPATKP